MLCYFFIFPSFLSIKDCDLILNTENDNRKTLSQGYSANLSLPTEIFGYHLVLGKGLFLNLAAVSLASVSVSFLYAYRESLSLFLVKIYF